MIQQGNVSSIEGPAACFRIREKRKLKWKAMYCLFSLHSPVFSYPPCLLIYLSPFRDLIAPKYSIILSGCFCHYRELLCMWLSKGTNSTETFWSMNLLIVLLPPYFLVEGTIMFALERLWYWGRYWGVWQQELLTCNFPFHPSNECQIL